MPRDPDNMFGGEPPRREYPGRQRHEISALPQRRHPYAYIASVLGTLLLATAAAICFGWIV
ncbi:MAG: hypothetical protein ACM30I_10545 [Gemmatimonas sp.]